jgi:Cu(I)/Ag(I) efflux system membrane fusion protein
MRGRYAALAILALGTGIAGGVTLERFHLAAPGETADAGPGILYWVAPMDPNFRRDGPGKSPMGMDLIPVYEGEEPGGDPAEVQLSAAEINAIGVRTAVARVEPVAARIETVGFVGYDEHRTSHVHMRVDGWIEDLRVRAVGDRVEAGDLLFDLYAPEITIASSELMRATRRRDADEIAIARRKLRNFGVTPRQIDEMAEADLPAQHIRVYAPQDGVVIGIEAADGMFLQPETRAMSLTDLSSVWLLVDVFERDIARLAPDMTALARFEHLPGRVFEGRIDYVYPELDPVTRTLPVRLVFDNAEGLLKPNMFGTVSLVPAATREAVTVPSEAVIRTGRAERVILKTGDGTFRPRLVTTGLRDSFGEGARTEIVQGLAPGEEVVASAQFLIDSESALNAGLMRFAPTEAAPAPGKGVLVALDRERRKAVIRHEAIAALDWPTLETRFAIRADVALDRLAEGAAVRFEAVRGADGLLALSALAPDDGIDATGTGVVRAVTPDGKLTLSHDPVPALGWPAMVMDMPLKGVDAATVPVGEPISFDLAKGEDGLYTIVGVRAAGEPARTGHAMPDAAPETDAAVPETSAPMTVDGEINAVDAAGRTANVTHGPIAAIGMPGMTMDFPLASGLDPETLAPGPATLSLGTGADGMLMLVAAEAKAPPMTVTGTVNSIDAEARTANVTHGPMAEIGMPGMTMDFPLAPDLDPTALPVGQETALLIAKGADFSLTLVGVSGEAVQ